MAQVLYEAVRKVDIWCLRYWAFKAAINPSLVRSATMSSPRDDLHNVFLTNCSEVTPNEKYITVQGIPEKSRSKRVPQSMESPTKFARPHRHGFLPQQCAGLSRAMQSQSTFHALASRPAQNMGKASVGTCRPRPVRHTAGAFD